jgi:predicted nuclease of predicted toxin-antitoxin system
MGTLASELGHLAPDAAAPRVYADANLPAGIVSMMRHELGWDVLFVVEDERLRRAHDRDHFAHALELDRTIVTLDHDFCNDAAFPPALSPGVIVCSVPNETALARVLRYVDRDIFRADGAADLPLRGRKIELSLDRVLELSA